MTEPAVNSSPRDRHAARFRRVLDYIDAHLDEDLSLDGLSDIAAFSKFHFHREFVALFGIGVREYIRLCRLKRASYQLAFRSDQPITDIALASGYEAPEGFARAFRNSTGQSPSEFRREPRWASWSETLQPLSRLRREHMSVRFEIGQVEIIRVEDIRVGVCEHRGDPRLIGDSIRRFIAWRKRSGWSPHVSATYNILYDNPQETPPGEFRLDLCAAVDRDVTPNEFGIVGKTIPGGRCAVLRHVGSDDHLGEALRFLYADWLAQSGEEPRDFPPYVERLRLFPDTPEHEAQIDVFLPLR